MQSFMENNIHPDITNGEVSLGESECPFAPAAQRHTAAGALSNADWWPNQLNLKILRRSIQKS